MGQDEPRARAVLLAMQARLARDPHEALELPPGAPPADVRAAFLRLTKTYHPARYARMSPEVQRLANEVFLALRAAHDALARPRPAGPARGSGVMPALARPATTPPAARPPTPQPFPRLQPPPRSLARPTPPTGVARTSTPTHGPRPAVPRAATPPEQPPSRASSTDLQRPTRTPSASPSPPVRSGTPPPAAPAAPDRELAPIYDLLASGLWEPARAALRAFAAKAPDAPRYRALLAYADGREAQLTGRRDEARVELDRALQLDPDLQLAKTALAELFTRRK